MSQWKYPALLIAAMLPFAVVSCGTKTGESPAAASQTNAVGSTNQQVFQVKGVVREVKTGEKTLVIRHDEIPNYMPAMTMPFSVRDTNQFAGLSTGDTVTFKLHVTDKDSWIEDVKKSGVIQILEQSPTGQTTVRVVRDVEPLKVGEALTEYRFTNEFGKVVSTSQFKGKAFAFNFIFTRCPLPNFCPFLSNTFGEAERKLKAMTNGPTNWHLLTISFDPENDTPEMLQAYAKRFQYDPAHWSFVSGDLTEITAIGDQVGQYFGRDETGGFNHNLRTVVIDAQGRLHKVIIGNTWTSDELVTEMVKAASVKP